MSTPSLTLLCQTLRARPRVRAMLVARLQQALDALVLEGFEVQPGAPDTFVSEASGFGYPNCGYSRVFVDPADGSVLQVRSGLQLGAPEQDTFLCGFVMQVLRPDTVAVTDLIGLVLSSETDRRVLCEVNSPSSPGASGWDVREGLTEVEALLERRGHLEPSSERALRDASRLAQKVVKTLQP